MGALHQRLLLEALEAHLNLPHLRNGIHADLPSAPVGGDPPGLDVDPSEPLVSHEDLELGGLADDCSVDLYALHEALGADAGVLLVADRRYD